MFVEMKVRGLALDAVSNMPIIILRDDEDRRSLQIWVGIFEANAIALELEKVPPPRPMTHDLIKNILEAVDARVGKVVVTDLKDNTFFAVLHLQLGDAEYTVDSRPSDAIALALRVGAPIYVDGGRHPQGQEPRGVQGGRAGEGRRSGASSGSGCRTSSRRTSRSSTRPERAGPVRVALFTNNYLPFCGGVPTSVETLRAGLEAAGHEAWVFGPRFATGAEAAPRVVRYPSIPAATYPEFALAVPYSRRAARLVAALDVDVFHAHHPFLLGPAARRLARRHGRPLVFTYHTRYEKYAHYVPLRRQFRRDARRPAEHTLSPRAPTRHRAVRSDSRRALDPGRGQPIAVVPTGLDLERFRPADRRAARARLPVPADAPLVLYVGRLDPEKSVDRILLAFERVASTVVGGAPDPGGARHGGAPAPAARGDARGV